jgi:hypothetical protein
MRSTWPYLAAVVAAGIGLGTWIAGLPSSDTGIIVADGGTLGQTPGTRPPGDTLVILPTSSFPPITVTPSTNTETTAGDTTIPERNPVPTTVETTTTVAITTTTPPTTTPPSTVPPTTAAPTTLAPANELLDRADVRLVLANGDGRFNLVGANVNRIEPLGYTTIDQTDIPRPVERTVLYYRPGFDDEAARLAADLLVPAALLEPLPDTPITANDELGDIIAVLGPDAVR